LVNGFCKPKDKLIIARDCHKSAVAGMMLSGAVPKKKALAENPDAVGVYITRHFQKCIQSAHKTLPALTQGAYLHVKGSRVDVKSLNLPCPF